MTHIELKYDPFSVKTVLLINGKEASLCCFGDDTGIRLIEWINDFFPEVIKRNHIGIGEECSIKFYGTQSYFEEVRLFQLIYQDDKLIEIPLEPKMHCLEKINEETKPKVLSFYNPSTINYRTHSIRSEQC